MLGHLFIKAADYEFCKEISEKTKDICLMANKIYLKNNVETNEKLLNFSHSNFHFSLNQITFNILYLEYDDGEGTNGGIYNYDIENNKIHIDIEDLRRFEVFWNFEYYSGSFSNYIKYMNNFLQDFYEFEKAFKVFAENLEK